MAEQMKPSGVDWIGEIPSEWKIQRFKFCGAVLYGCPFNSDFFTNEDTGVPLIRIRDITSGTISTYYEGHYSSEYMVHSGDVLVGMDGDFNVRIWENLDALLNQRCCKILSSKKINARYLAYYLPHQLYIVNQLTWSTTVKHLLAEDIGNIPVAYPQLNEQQDIVRLLDKECAQIDSIAADLEKQIELLQQYKQSLITETVTKGLDKSVPMKDSGVEWIGEIPSEWKITKVRFVTELRSEQGSYNPGDKYIGLENISSYTGTYIATESEYDSGTYDIYKAGDLLFSKLRPYLAKALIADDCGFCTGELAIIKEYKGDIRYLFYYMLSDGFLKMTDASTYGSKMPRASWDYIKNLQIPAMEKREQQAIADYLDEKCATINSILDDKQAQLKVIQQHKKSLIYEYVTGKKRVKEVQ